MADATIGTDFLQALDVHLHLVTEFALNTVFFLDRLTEPISVFFREIFCPSIEVDTEGLEDLAAGRPSNAINIRESNLDTLIIRQVDAGDTEHSFFILDAACASGSCR